jgi:tetratricopeptide (TPR) repeat protein
VLLQIACNNSSNDENKNITLTDNKIDSLQANIKQYPDSLLLKENLIQYYRDLNDYNKAIELVNKYIVEDTIEARLQHIKAVLLLENKDTIQSLKFFEKSIELQPNPEDYLYVANIFATQKDQESLSLTDSIIKNYSPYFKGSFVNKRNILCRH